MIDVLHVVQIVEHLEHLLDLRQGVRIGDLIGILRDHRQLRAQEAVAGILQILANGREIADLGGHLEAVLQRLDVGSAGVQRRHHDLVLVHARLALDDDQADLVKHVGDAAVGAQRAAVLVENVADIGRGAVAVVGHGGNDHGHAARRVALVLDLLVVDAADLAGCLCDGALDIVIGHVVGLRLRDHVAQLAIGRRIAAAVSHRDGDFTADLGENLAARGVRLALFVLNICPLGMA